jgi:hypothetical protein
MENDKQCEVRGCPLINFGECIGDKCSFSRVISSNSSANENDANKVTRCEVAALDIWNERLLMTFQDMLSGLYTVCDSMGLNHIKNRLDSIEKCIEKNDNRFYKMIQRSRTENPKKVIKKSIKKITKKVKKKLIRK